MVMERQHAPNVGNDDIHALRQFRLARVTLEKDNAVRETIGSRELPGELNTVIGLDGEYTPRSRAAGQQRENAGAAAVFSDSVTGAYRSRNRFGVRAAAPRIRPHHSHIAD